MAEKAEKEGKEGKEGREGKEGKEGAIALAFDLGVCRLHQSADRSSGLR